MRTIEGMGTKYQYWISQDKKSMFMINLDSGNWSEAYDDGGECDILCDIHSMVGALNSDSGDELNPDWDDELIRVWKDAVNRGWEGKLKRCREEALNSHWEDIPEYPFHFMRWTENQEHDDIQTIIEKRTRTRQADLKNSSVYVPFVPVKSQLRTCSGDDGIAHLDDLYCGINERYYTSEEFLELED